MARFKKRTLDRMVAEFDSPDGVYDREVYLDYLTEQVGRESAFADALEEVDLAVGNDDVRDIMKALRKEEPTPEPPKKAASKKRAKESAPASAFDFGIVDSIPF